MQGILILFGCLEEDFGKDNENPILHIDTMKAYRWHGSIRVLCKEIIMKYHFVCTMVEDKHMYVVKTDINDNLFNSLTLRVVN